ncbi:MULTISPECIES: hypothetical protein [Pantoea]|uniref:hypothetical protein n=1 Tax=Pantoea TaxID=53335 RepID=UPI0018EB71F7|nr:MULTISPECIES: hypothetical protein [Pantoea]
MATNNFKAFANTNSANVTSQAEYEALAALLSGFQSGKASSAQINKVLRQSSTMAYVLAQFISDSASVDVLDNGSPATILANLKAGLTALTPGRLLNIQIFVVNGQYAPTPGTKKIIVEAISGGGGSRSGSTANGQTGGSTPGYHGQYCKSLFELSAIGTPLTVTVGSGGTPNNYGGATYFGPYMSLGGGNPADGTLSTSGAGVAGSAYHRTGAQNDSTGKVLANSSGTSLSSPIIQVTAGTACGFSAPNSPFPGGFRGRGADGVYASAGVSYTGATGIDGMVVVWEYA